MKCVVAAVASMMMNQPSKLHAIPIESSMIDTGLEKVLRQYRTHQAFTRSVPANSIYGNKLMHSILAKKPMTIKQLTTLKGMGPKRCQAYGPDIIKLINNSIKNKDPIQPDQNTGKQAIRAAAKYLMPKSAGRPKPKPRPRPRPRPKPGCALKPLSVKPAASRPAKKSVYVLELENGRVYVGSSANVNRRIQQHMSGCGSAYTRVYKPTGVQLPRLGNICGDGDAAERDETLRYMSQRGIPFVRGWKFTQVVMSEAEFAEAEANIRELHDLCRRCGYKGHFVSQCRATYDRWGSPC